MGALAVEGVATVDQVDHAGTSHSTYEGSMRRLNVEPGYQYDQEQIMQSRTGAASQSEFCELCA